MDDNEYTGSTYDPQDPPIPDNVRDASRFSGNTGDPGFMPQTSPDMHPYDMHHALEGMMAVNGLSHSQQSGDAAATDPNQLPVDNSATTGDDDGTSPNKPMTDQQLITSIKQKIDSSHQWYGNGKLADGRIKADMYYRGEPRGDEMEGHSQVVSRDVAEAVDSAMPSMMRIFAGGDEVVHFEPTTEADEDAAKQATDYINHIFSQENEGFMILYTWFKDGFLKKNGIVKTWHDVRQKRTKENYQGLTQAELQVLQSNPDLQVTDIKQYVDNIMMPDSHTNQPMPTQQPCFDCVVIQTKPEKRVRVMNVPPDEFIIERRAVSIHTAGFLAHRAKRTISDLLECGYDADKVNSIPRGEDEDLTQERTERFGDEDAMPFTDGTESDPSMRKIWVTEAYIKCDYDGDGIAEWRCVILAGDSDGSGGIILDNVETDDHAFADLTPTPECHKFYGMSFYDQTNDIQDIKTALLRGILDSTYLANNGRMGAVDGQVNMDDLLDSRAGGIVRLKNANALVPIESTPISEAALSVVGYIDQVKEKRTGVSAAGAGLNPNILNSSATGADILNNNNQQRLELIARIYAETGVKRLFRRIFQLTCQYQDVPRTVKLRGKWVNVDPRDWKDRMDVTASVGLGLGTKQQQASVALQMLDLDKQIIQLQGGMKGPFLTPENVYAKLAKLVEAVGWKSIDPYYTNPQNYQPPPPEPPTPAQQLQQLELQTKQTQAQTASDTAKANALSSVNQSKIDFDMKTLDLEAKKLDLAIKAIELEALRIQSGAKVAGQADNLSPPGATIPDFMMNDGGQP